MQATFPAGMHEQVLSNYRKSVTNIYKARDGRCFHLHASLNPDPSLQAIGLPRDMPELDTVELSWEPFFRKDSRERCSGVGSDIE